MTGFLSDPATTFRQHVHIERDRGSLWRRPAILLLCLGCFVSLLASGRISARLIVDGATSFAFIPIFEVLALMVVTRAGRICRPMPLASRVDLFFAGQVPWLLWLAVAGAVAGVIPPREVGPWPARVIEASTLLPLGWSLWVDYHFFREVTQRSSREATGDLVLHRAIEWPLAIGYFFGIAIWSLVQPTLAGWVPR